MLAIVAIAAIYNSFGHAVSHLHADAESAFSALKVELGQIGILLTLSPPAQHQQRLERHYQTVNGRMRATLAGLPYTLPPELYILLKRSVTH